MFGRLDALRRLLLESVYDPDFVGELHRVDHAERVALERQRDLEDARAQSRFQWRVVSVHCRSARCPYLP